MIEQRLFEILGTTGSTAVLIVLFGASLCSWFIIAHRLFDLRREEHLGAKLWDQEIKNWMKDPSEVKLALKADEVGKNYPCIEGQLVSLVGVSDGNIKKLELRAQSFLKNKKHLLERNLSLLGSIGSNAPFIGLFGTVLGIIKTFHDMGVVQGKTINVSTMSLGLSEALIATAVGLLVAIPSVFFYNYFQKKVQRIINRSESLADFLASHQA